MPNKPFVLKSDNLIYFDVDETLVFWRTDNYHEDDLIKVKDPYARGNEFIKMVPHQRNINLLKRVHGQGRTVVVWSAGGVFWAESVVKTLKLESYVDLIISKPYTYVDDRPMEDWKLNRIYLSKELPQHE